MYLVFLFVKTASCHIRFNRLITLESETVQETHYKCFAERIQENVI